MRARREHDPFGVGGALLILGVAVTIVAVSFPIQQREAVHALEAAGYDEIAVRPALDICMKGRTAFHWTATAQGYRHAGKVCVGGFVRPAITETGGF